MSETGVAPEPRRRSVQCISPKGLHRIAYLEWGDARNRDVLVCVHGLTRCARDFDDLARALCGQFRVVCPDVAGRGDSDRLADPMLYGIPQYVPDMVALIARLDVETVSWLGTSMGGADSDLLSRKTTQEMARRGPKARVVEIPGVGHAPTLMHADQIAIVRDFLLEGASL